MNKVARCHSFLAFQLHVQNLQRVFSTSYKQMIAVSQKLSGSERTLRQCRIPNMQILAAKRSKDSWPWLKSAHAITNLFCGKSKVDSAIFFLQNRRQGCLRIILRTG